ncbi:MAG TPA: 6-pyruvoyl tetrahydrobiopterin synthase [Nitrospina sp.]|jgi:6-pyruvoyltetrahydropterin/6-carboxytetrahydropterin synthase|nr:6-pyruvoyl tetrahydrobiopterin synthase [Nitrospinota bacterium]MDP6335373.1 6-carboxytetrahydropterin synthase [Nitrospinaceae bacterium]MDP7147599.1 6-carboxytetrahydropterin synthase [Nitrospinaceae bacterium]MDP7611517.1 6-carboxytetrahydropterin synthase [Nitrospinaceae bacterium]HAX47129.1 6-pyruvoyl tetrahydrobiopterin synthase [Nitrospina sp.]|tara:strand:+ start:379 stop:792 length:414 start_codon:yes stop_codon:yes gene_type:complete
MIFITRKHHFCASHRLYNPSFSDEKNEATFGLCNNPNGHGHNYVLEVTLSGEIADDTGMVFDLKELKKLTQQEIIDKVDHKNLNVDVDFLTDIIPTAENLAIRFWKRLEPKITKGQLYEVKLYESERNFVVYRGENL